MNKKSCARWHFLHLIAKLVRILCKNNELYRCENLRYFSNHECTLKELTFTEWRISFVYKNILCQVLIERGDA